MRWRGFLSSLTHCVAGIGTAALTMLLLSIASAQAEKRVALVIGNGAYINAPHLPNPSHDAEDVTIALKRSNFEVIKGTDLDQAGMQDAIIRFARAAQTADVGIFYYSGHAMQFNGINYLIPIDAKLRDEADLYRFTRVDDVLGYLQQAKNLKILVLDSCRDNPLAENFKRSINLARAIPITRGLARMEAPIGTIVAFSTQAGQQAEDGYGRNSPYTTAFLNHIDEPNEIGDIFRDISADVYQATGNRQLPELSLSIIGKFYLQGTLQITLPPASVAPVTDPCAAAETHWKAAESVGTIEAYRDHLARFPTCAFSAPANARIDAMKGKTHADVTPSVPQSDQAAQAWDATKETTSVAVLEDFIRQFGGTVYGSMARARLDELKRSNVAALPPKPEPAKPTEGTVAGNWACGAKSYLGAVGRNWNSATITIARNSALENCTKSGGKDCRIVSCVQNEIQTSKQARAKWPGAPGSKRYCFSGAC